MQGIHLVAFVLFICCLRDSVAVYWPCDSNTNCTADGSKCFSDSGLCKCDDFSKVFSEDFTKCLTTSLYGDECEERVQCNLMPSGINCKSGVCECADGHTYVHGRCRQLNNLNETCDSDLDCYFGYDRNSVVCQNKICTCANGYYHRYGNICRRKSMDINDACIVHTDCDGLGEKFECINLTCQVENETTTTTTTTTTATTTTATTSKTETGEPTTTSTADTTTTSTIEPTTTKGSTTETITETTDAEIPELVNGLPSDLTETEIETDPDPENSRNFREIAVQTSIDAFELKPLKTTITKYKNAATTTTATATASTNTSSAASRRFSTKRRRSSAIRSATYNRYYDNNKTFSTRSNTEDDNDDNKRFGSSCTESGKTCTGVPHSICANSICLCRQGYYHQNGKCLAELGEIAETADECEFAFDPDSKKCLCQKNYFYERNLRDCRKPIQYHLSCTSNSQCSPYGAAYCLDGIPRRCSCKEYAEYDELQQMCLYKQGLGAECESNDNCPVDHSICVDRFCVCKDNYFERNNTCLPGVGAECAVHDDCVIEHTICDSETMDSEERDKTCQCRKGFVHFKDECLKEAVEIEDDCIETEQCKPLLAKCIDRKCSCSSEQHFQFGRCQDKKELGEACSREGECFVEKNPENVECRNSVCQCKFNYQADVEKTTCIRVIPNKKNSSGRPSALKIITFLLIGSAFLVTSAAIKQAYY